MVKTQELAQYKHYKSAALPILHAFLALARLRLLIGIRSDTRTWSLWSCSTFQLINSQGCTVYWENTSIFMHTGCCLWSERRQRQVEWWQLKLLSSRIPAVGVWLWRTTSRIIQLSLELLGKLDMLYHRAAAVIKPSIHPEWETCSLCTFIHPLGKKYESSSTQQSYKWSYKIYGQMVSYLIHNLMI